MDLVCHGFHRHFQRCGPGLNAWVSAQLLNGVASCFGRGSQALYDVLFWLILYFSILICDKVVNNIYYILYRIGGELVTNHIKEEIMEKAREVDLSSFDKPDFYERLENANREAGVRPIQIMTSTFDIISRLISMISFIVMLSAVTPWAPIVMIAVSVPSAVINFIYRRKNFLYMRHRSKDRRQLNYYSDIMVNKDMVKEVKLFGLADTFLGKYREVFRNYFRGLRSLMVKEEPLECRPGAAFPTSSHAPCTLSLPSVCVTDNLMWAIIPYTPALLSPFPPV